MKTIATWTASICFLAAWMAAAAHFDIERFGPETQAQAEANELANRAWVAAQTCGENSAAKWLSDTELRCTDKHGRNARIVVAGVKP